MNRGAGYSPAMEIPDPLRPNMSLPHHRCLTNANGALPHAYPWH